MSIADEYDIVVCADLLFLLNSIHDLLSCRTRYEADIVFIGGRFVMAVVGLFGIFCV